MRTFRADDRLFRSNDLITTELDDETVLMSIEAGSYYGVEGTARKIWNTLETPLSFSELVESMVRDYRVTGDALTLDLQKFLSEMEQEGLLDVE